MQKINKMLKCSIGNITRSDAEIFREQSRLLANNPRSRWVVDIVYGFVVKPDILPIPALVFGNLGLSENTIRLLTEVWEIYGVESICFNRDDEPLEGWPFYQW